MTKRITQNKKALAILLMLFGLLTGPISYAQTYCTAWSYYGCLNGTTHYALERLRFKDLSGTYLMDKAADGCNAGAIPASNTAGNGYTLVSTKPVFTLSSGSTYTVESSCSYGTLTTTSAVVERLYIWIDLNRDGNFAANEFMSTGWATMIASFAYKGGNLVSNTFTVPCGISAGQ